MLTAINGIEHNNSAVYGSKIGYLREMVDEA